MTLGAWTNLHNIVHQIWSASGDSTAVSTSRRRWNQYHNFLKQSIIEATLAHSIHIEFSKLWSDNWFLDPLESTLVSLTCSTLSIKFVGWRLGRTRIFELCCVSQIPHHKIDFSINWGSTANFKITMPSMWNIQKLLIPNLASEVKDRVKILGYHHKTFEKARSDDLARWRRFWWRWFSSVCLP